MYFTNFVQTIDISQLVLPHDDLSYVNTLDLHVFEELLDLALVGLDFFYLCELESFVSSES